MGLFDGPFKKFASKLTDRMESWATAFEEHAQKSGDVTTQGSKDLLLMARILRVLGKIITETVEAE